jgi:hypothetical protein
MSTPIPLTVRRTSIFAGAGRTLIDSTLREEVTDVPEWILVNGARVERTFFEDNL